MTLRDVLEKIFIQDDRHLVDTVQVIKKTVENLEAAVRYYDEKKYREKPQWLGESQTTK